jgi:AraC-like DNA-binding protein
MVLTSSAPCVHRNERCWRPSGLPEVVMFNGHYNHDFIPHSHDVMTAVLVTKGGFRLACDDFSCIVSAGDIVVIGAQQVHGARPLGAEGWEMRTLHAPAEMFFLKGDLPAGNRGVRLSRPMLPYDSAGASLFLNMHRNPLPAESEQVDEMLHKFVGWFQRHLDFFAPELVADKNEDAELEKIKRLILEAAFESTFIDDIAEQAGLSIFSLIRRFTKTYGMSPHAWRMQLRANEAARQLSTGEPLVKVAAACGFSDQAHLTRTFKRVYGVTPGQYKMIH